jgi:long-chain fatty acid transport protein
MKKQFLLIAGLVSLTTMAFGGGIVTNSNQSAAWVRTLVRDASTDADAVYYNPAGLTKLNDGFHFSLNSQTIFQSKDVTNNYRYLSPTPKKYEGEIKVPVFPGFYAAWKNSRIAISFGFNPIGGGGGAKFKDGLPSFEIGPSDMVPTLAAYGATAYKQDVYFKGTSVYFGYQLGVTFKINDNISVFGGARYVTAKNTYEGYLRNVQVNMSGTWTDVSAEFTNLAVQATMGAGAANSISGTMGALLTGGIPGTYTLAQAQTAGALNATQVAQIEGGLTAIGLDPSKSISEIQGDCDAAAPQYTAAAARASATSQLTSILFNQEADVTQKGWGISPIIGLNLSFAEKLNIGIKYEFATKMELKNDTKSDFITGVNLQTGAQTTMFPDGEKSRSDMPAMFSLGVDYKFTPKFSAAAGFHYYWDKTANYGKKLDGEYVANSKVIDHNYYELGLSLGYNITDKLVASIGYLLAKTGVSEDYQSDLSFSLSSNTFGGGLGYKITDNLMVNAGVCYTAYNEGKKTYDHMFSATQTLIPCTDTYYKDNLIIGLGVDFNF